MKILKSEEKIEGKLLDSLKLNDEDFEELL